MAEDTTPSKLTDEDMKTSWASDGMAGLQTQERLSVDGDADGSDADGSDADGSDADGSDGDATDSADGDASDGADADGQDA